LKRLGSSPKLGPVLWITQFNDRHCQYVLRT
jgi:hypothetical protein